VGFPTVDLVVEVDLDYSIINSSLSSHIQRALERLYLVAQLAYFLGSQPLFASTWLN